MPYFKREDTYEVVYRPHEFNSEALSGEISMLPETEDCVLLSHTPNTKFGWDVVPIENLGAKQGLDKLKTFATEGDIFYTLIPSEHLFDYVKENDKYTLIEGGEGLLDSPPSLVFPPPSKAKQAVPEVSRRVVDEEPSPRTTKALVKPLSPAEPPRSSRKPYAPKLMRDVNNEKPIKIRI